MNHIEEEIRMLLRSKVSQAPVQDEPPRVVLRRTRVMRGVNGITAVATTAAVVVGAILVVQSFREPNSGLLSSPPVPWIDAPADQAAIEPAAYQGGFCHASEVDFSVSTRADGGELRFARKPGSRIVGRLDASCLLHPKEGIRIRLLDGQGRALLPVEVGFGSAPAIWVEPGRPAFLAFDWSNYCGPNVSTIRFEVALPYDGVRMTGSPADSSGAPRCNDPRSGSRITLRSAGTMEIAGEPRSTLSRLEVAIDAPLNVARGGKLLYTVTLLNRSDSPIRLEPCPAFRQSMGSAGGGTYRLNCEGAGGKLDPGSAVRFAMELVAPIEFGHGDELSQAAISWQLEGSGAPKIAATVWLI